ncbi:unnamed protein product, partial [Timema podura]|nr:unnamed protein product [Timema podura]
FNNKSCRLNCADNRSLEVEVSPLLSKVVQDSSALVPNPRLLEVMGNSQRTGQSGLTLDTTIKPVSKDNYVLKNMHNLGVPSLELHYADISAQLNKMVF